MKKSKSSSELEGGTDRKLLEYSRRRADLDVIPFVIDSLNPDLSYDAGWMVKINENYDLLRKGIIGETNIICGPSLVGKTGLVYWLKNNNPDCEIIKVDCLFHSTHTAFITALISELSKFVNSRGKSKSKIRDPDELTKKIVLDQDIRLGELDRFIRDKPKQYIIMIKHAEKLVEIKKQLVLYNLFEWIKSEIKDKVGIVLITKKLDFTDKLEKRVRSRMNAKIITIYGPKDLETVKKIIDKRLDFAIRAINEKQNADGKRLVTKIRNMLSKNTELDKTIKKQIDRGPKSIVFFLEAYRLAFALALSGEKQHQVDNLKFNDLCDLFNTGLEKALGHLCPYINKDEIFLYSCNYPEYFVMAIIRVMLLENKPKITFKEIIHKFDELKQKHGNSNTSFNFSRKIIERAVRNLNNLRLLQFVKIDFDFENAQITSNMSPEAIFTAIKSVSLKPIILKSILDE